MAVRIVFAAKDAISLEEFTLPNEGDGQVRVRSLYSLISAGTETTVLTGAFARGTHWERYATYPFYPGYSCVGLVEEVAPGVEDVSVGDRVVVPSGHSSESVIDAHRCTLVPESVESEHAVWFNLAKVALVGAHVAGYQLGDTVVVVGAGPIGQMSVRWALGAGVRVVVVDPSARRLELAKAGGATDVVHATAEEAGDAILEACRGTRPRVVVDTTGRAQVLADLLPIPADHGKVVLVGDTGYPESQHLTSDVITRGVSVHGAHGGFTAAARDWDYDRSLHDLFFHLVSSGRFQVSGLNTHRYPPDRCKEAYGVLREKDSAMGVVFDWTAL